MQRDQAQKENAWSDGALFWWTNAAKGGYKRLIPGLQADSSPPPMPTQTAFLISNATGAAKNSRVNCFSFLSALAVSAFAQDAVKLPLGGGGEMEMMRVPPGTFRLGEAPDAVHDVTITKPFLIGKFPVTRGQFARFVAATSYRTESEKGASGGFGWESGKFVQKKEYTFRNPGFPQTDEHPVVMVDFADAQAFCAWMSRQTGRQIVLPTEAQWEFAARGNGNAGEAWTAANSPGGTQPVGRNKANGYGIHDMIGNVWEWCEDWFAPYQPAPAVDPVQTSANLGDKPRRVLRGGAFSRPAADADVARRYRNDPGSRNADNGFRVVALEMPAAPAAPKPASPPVNLEQSARPAQAHDEVPGRISTAPPARDHLEQEHAAPESSRSRGWIIYAMLAAGALVVWKLIKRILNGSGTQPLRMPDPAQSAASEVPARSGFSVRIVQDGFWIRSSIAPGTRLQARWMDPTGTHSRTIDYRPGKDGHFVFTGDQPSNVAVSVVDDDSGGGTSIDERTKGNVGVTTMNNDPEPSSRPRRTSGFSGHPSAY